MASAISPKSSKKENDAHAQRDAQAPAHPMTAAGPQPDLLALQYAVGNQAVSQMLQSERMPSRPEAQPQSEESAGGDLKPLPSANTTSSDAKGLPSSVRSFLSSSQGQPLDPETRTIMESRFGYDFGAVRIHVGGQAARSARSVNAKAYTVGRDVIFGEGKYVPSTTPGKELLAHELTHAIQQNRHGTAPELDTGAAHEHDAEGASNAAVNGEGLATVNASTGLGLARAIDDWLAGTPFIQDENEWSFTDLLDEIDEIEDWLDNQIRSSPESVRLNEALTELRDEVKRREETASQQPKKIKRRKKNRRKNRSKRQPQVDLSRTNKPELQKPRMLREQTSVQYSDPAEIRVEIDAIMAWLKRKDLAPDERKILQMELRNLTPTLQEDRAQKDVERRANKIQRAIVPNTSGNDADALAAAMSIIEDIRPSASSTYMLLPYQDEFIELSLTEAQKIYDEAVN